MRKTLFAIIVLSVLVLSGRAQIVSQFTWNSTANPVTQAVVGPNATSVSTAATIVTSGAGGTDGVAANGSNINLTLPGAVFELPGLDISEDFVREENTASFFTLGGMDIGINTGALYAKFVLNNGGVADPISLNNVFPVPTDLNFHTYRFIYDNVAGTFKAYLDGVLKSTWTAPGPLPLYWTGATTAVVGSGMDGSSSTIAVLDNFIAQVPLIVLPLQLLSFDAQSAGSVNALTWTTTREVGVSDFVVERSSDGVQFRSIGDRVAQQGFSDDNDYSFTDSLPTPTSFYRLKMTDLDGTFSYSPVKEVNSAVAVSVSCYPNPVVNSVNIRIDDPKPAVYRYSVVTTDGRILQAGVIEAGGAGQQTSLNLTAAPRGMLILRVQDADNSTAGVFKIFKQ
jgi:hypothetical protein